MPEVRFQIRWPDGSQRVCYSPSTVIRDYFAAGDSLRLADFIARARDGLGAASARVAARYGSPCSIAMAEIAALEHLATSQPPDGTVAIEAME